MKKTIIITILILFIVHEISYAYKTYPYVYGRECYRESSSTGEGWNAGRFSIELPPSSHGVILTLSDESKKIELNRLPIRFDLFDKYKNSIMSDFNIYRKDKEIVLEMALKTDEKMGREGGVAVLSLLNCLNENIYSQSKKARKIELQVTNVQIF